MRKVGLSFLALCLIFSIGCSKKSDDGPSPALLDKSANLKGTGESASDILSNDNFNKLIIEIAYVDGFRPTNEAISNFVDYFLKLRTFKEDIELVYNELPSPEEEELSLGKITELEDINRTVYNQGSTLAVYIYFADAPAMGDEEKDGLVTLGSVYRNTSMIIHEDAVRKLAAKSPFLTNAEVEIITIKHEFGHLLGLVDLGATPVNPHEDSEAINHCNVEGCLMRAELQFGVPINKSSPANSKKVSENGLKASCSISGSSVLQIVQNRTAKGLAPTVHLNIECLRDIRAIGGR